MTYDKFLTYQLAVNHGFISPDEPYDIQFDRFGPIYRDFEKSGFDRSDRNLYDCLDDYFNHRKEAYKKAAEQDSEVYDDPALDPENEFCSCGNMTDNFPVICDHCKWMAGA